MAISTDKNAQEAELTPHAKKLLRSLRQYDALWLSRSEIAEHIGKKRLTPYDIQLLESFADMGLGEARKVEIKGTIHWQYRSLS